MMKDWNKIKFAQNLIEFSFILPVLIFLTLVIFEVALFWQDVNAVYNLNTEINANIALLPYSEMAMNSMCPAADETLPTSAISILKKKYSALTLSNTTFVRDTDPAAEDGQEPFRLYKFISTTGVNNSTKPQIALWIDCRNPFENGIITQIEFYHKTMIMKATIPRFDEDPPIVVIPDTVFIASPKLSTIRHY